MKKLTVLILFLLLEFTLRYENFFCKYFPALHGWKWNIKTREEYEKDWQKHIDARRKLEEVETKDEHQKYGDIFALVDKLRLPA